MVIARDKALNDFCGCFAVLYGRNFVRVVVYSNTDE